MSMKKAILAAAAACALAASGCGGGEQPALNENMSANATQTVTSRLAAALPDNGFKAQLTLPDAPPKLRAGQKETIHVKVKNASDVIWWARGGEYNDRTDNKFYLAAGNRWLNTEGKLVTNMDGRYGLPKDLKPGEEIEIPLLITAPKNPGDYTLEVDLIQEQVSWFSDKGSPTARAKVTVAR